MEQPDHAGEQEQDDFDKIFDQEPKGAEKVNQVHIEEKKALCRGHSKCGHPKVGICSESREASTVDQEMDSRLNGYCWS